MCRCCFLVVVTAFYCCGQHAATISVDWTLNTNNLVWLLLVVCFVSIFVGLVWLVGLFCCWWVFVLLCFGGLYVCVVFHLFCFSFLGRRGVMAAAVSWMLVLMLLLLLLLSIEVIVATRGVTVSISAFLACHQCYCTGSSLAWGLNLRALVCGIF